MRTAEPPSLDQHGPVLTDLGGVTAFVLDASLGCLVADGDAFRLAGLRAADVVGRPLRELIDTRLADDLEPHCRRVLGGEPFACEHEADGRAWLARGVPLREGDAIHGALVVLYDVSGPREAAARRGHARTVAPAEVEPAPFAMALDAAGVGTFVWHLDEPRGELDARALALLGIGDPAVSLESALDAVIPPEDREACAAVLAAALDPAGAGRLQADVRVRRPDGTERWLAITARALFDGEPRRAIRLAGVVAAIDERKRDEASLRARDEALTVADRRKDEFLAVLAHELRNPLAPIRAGLELIRVSGDHREAVERTRGIMERQVGHMVRLIDDLLEVSRITSGTIQLARRPTALESLVGMALDANREAIIAGALELDLGMPDTPVWLDVDPTRIVQVISNVLHNAVKFTDAGGRIAIRAEVRGADDGSGWLALAVADTGIGIAPAALPRVFDLFAQDRAGRSRSRGGLGIGLALARRLVEMHGGRIDAHSDGPGCGTTITIELPLATGESGAPLPSSASEEGPAPTTRHRVLVVDDNLDAARAMAMLVEACGSETRVAGDGASAVVHAIEWPPTLVLLDIGMPGMDGYETCRRIRDAVGPGVTIAAVTGWGQEQDRRDAARAGFDAHLIKPADSAAIHALLAAPPGRR